MLIKIFTVFDQKAEAYKEPFYQPQTGQGVRIFADCINKQDHPFNLHPEDYTLFEIGLYDEESGEIAPHSPLKSLGNGVEFIKSLSLPDYVDETHSEPHDQPIQPGS